MLKDAVDSSLPELRPWEAWALGEPSVLAALETRLVGFEADFDEARDWLYGVFDAEGTRVLGGAGLHPRLGPGALEIGYWVRTSDTGRGIATATAGALTATGFMVAGVDRIEIHCDARNIRSAAIPRRLGYELLETRIRDTFTPDGRARDTMIWAITREGWAHHDAAASLTEAGASRQ
ncbi:MAG: GNAT family N-acetyltransferase [Gemmatimonadaceae bacterium]